MHRQPGRTPPLALSKRLAVVARDISGHEAVVTVASGEQQRPGIKPAQERPLKNQTVALPVPGAITTYARRIRLAACQILHNIPICT